jgi:Uma2 family endonuclease
MTTAAEGDQLVVMRDVGWNGYTALLRIRGERSRPKMVYLDGDVYLMSPAYRHARSESRLTLFVMVIVEELNIRCVPARDTTFRRHKNKGGAEADESFYLANAARVAGKDKLHLQNDPPPDLVVETAHTHDIEHSVEVWRRFGVPEVWVCEANSLHILVLHPNGRYVESATSAAFPFLSASEVLARVNRPDTGNETAWVGEVRRWVQDVLAPRARNGANEILP